MPNDATYATLRDKLGPMGGQLLVSVLRDLLNGTVRELQLINITLPLSTSFIGYASCTSIRRQRG